MLIRGKAWLTNDLTSAFLLQRRSKVAPSKQGVISRGSTELFRVT